MIEAYYLRKMKTVGVEAKEKRAGGFHKIGITGFWILINIGITGFRNRSIRITGFRTRSN